MFHISLLSRFTSISFSVLCLLSLFSDTALASIQTPAGWSQQQDGQSQHFSYISDSKTLSVLVQPWSELNGRSQATWLKERKNRIYGNYSIRKQLKGVKRGSASGTYSLSREINKKGGMRRLSLLFICTKGSQVRMLDIYGPLEWFSSSRFKPVSQIFEKACEENPDVQLRPPTSRKIIKRPDFNPGKAPKGLQHIWHVGYWVTDMSGYKGRQKAIATFADKTATDNLKLTFSKGLQQSRKEKPDDWGVWQKKEGDLEVKWNDSKSYTDYYYTNITRPGRKDERIKGCWNSTFTSSLPLAGTGAYNTAVAFNSWCFDKSGRFSNDKTVGINASTGESTTSSSRVDATGYSATDKNGWYRIDGHVIQLVYDNGNNITTSFGLQDTKDRKNTDLLLGGSHYDN